MSDELRHLLTTVGRIPYRRVSEWEPDPCPGCGKPKDQHWCDVTASWEQEPMVTWGRWSCHTVGCQYGPDPKSFSYGH